MEKKNYEFPTTQVRNSQIRTNILAGSVNKVTINGSDIPFEAKPRLTTDSTPSRD